MQFWEEVKSVRRELVDGRHRLKVIENVCTFAKHDWSMTKKAKQMVECQLDLHISMNEDLVQELKGCPL